VIVIDGSQVAGFGDRMAKAPDVMRREATKGITGLMGYGIGVARSNINSQSGKLAGGIRILQPVSVGAVITGSYGVRKSEVIYAFQREKGGTIKPKRGKYLVFPGRNGGLVFVRSVTQEGSHYMEKSSQAIQPRLRIVMQAAVSRAIASV